MRRRLTALRLALLASTLLAAACSSDSGPPTSDIVTTIPFRAGEELNYVLVDDDGKQLGTGALGVRQPPGDPDALALSASFRSETSSDQSVVIVDAQTLKPESGRREIVTRNDTEVVEVTYTEEGALIKQGERQSGLSVPEHAYDNDTSLFLWRTIAFRPDYEASYVTIITNRRSRQKVNLLVQGKESVTVPAGQFDAWRLEIRTSNARQVAWFADTPTRPLVRYDNDRGVIFELTSQP